MKNVSLGAYFRNFTVWLGVCVTLGLCPVQVVSFDRACDIIVRASHSNVYEPNTNASASNNRRLCSLQFFLTWTSNRYVSEMYVITFHFSVKLRNFCSGRSTSKQETTSDVSNSHTVLGLCPAFSRMGLFNS